VHVVDPETGEDRDATPFEGVQARVLGVSRRRPGHVLLGLNKDNPELHDAYLLELATGNLERVAENPGFYDWLVDNELRPRGGMRMREDGSGSFELDGTTLLELDADDAISSQAIGFTADDASLYVITPAGANAAGLVKLTPGAAPETLVDDPTYDVASAELHPVTRAVEIVSFLRARLEHQVHDPALAPDVEAISALNPGDAVFISRDHADRIWTVGFTADDGPVAYYAFDREARAGRFLFTQHDDLAGYRLSAMEPFSFAARDGLEINGYLTFPPDAARTGLPAVLFVQGGPWA
jgi:dipeptidyl aminopeptidase/acylaminoacyl peptidase